MTLESVCFVWERSFDSASEYDRVLQSLSQGDLRAVENRESKEMCSD